MVRRRLFLALFLTVSTGTMVGRAWHQTAHAASGSFSVSYTGTNYYQPTDYFNHCGYWTWLTRCYLDSHSGPSPQTEVSADAQFISSNGLGRFQRVWISLDQLMNWDVANGYQSFNTSYLHNVDDALHRFAEYGIKVDLVLLTYSQGANAANEFHPEALDGRHPTMRGNYLRALGDFVSHLAADPIDSSTIAVVDLQNEAYYQLETYFSDSSRLGSFSQCDSGSGKSDWGCVDRTIIHPWVLDMYTTVKSAGPGFLYTVSDAGGLLKDGGIAMVQRESLYPVDVYDVHLYSDSPASNASNWALGRFLDKPWFVGEAGCGVGNTACTYDGTNAAPIARWWLTNLKDDGAQAVLIEEGGTAFTYPNGPDSRTLTATGQVIKQFTLAFGSPSATSTPAPYTSTPTPVAPTSTPMPTATQIPATSTPQATSTATVVVTPQAIDPPLQIVWPTLPPGVPPYPWVSLPGSGLPVPVMLPEPPAGTLQTAFDTQGVGVLSIGMAGGFSGTVDNARMLVDSGSAFSAPNSLTVNVGGGGSVYAFRDLANAPTSFDLAFRFKMGSDFSLPNTEYMVLAQMRPNTPGSSSAGTVNLVLTGDGGIYISYVDSWGTQQYIWTSYRLDRNWHRLELKQTTGVGSGSLALLVDGIQVGAAAVDTGGQPIRYLALGDEYSPPDAATTGHVYFDNVDGKP